METTGTGGFALETKGSYTVTPECPQNGQSASSDAPNAPAEWFEPDRISVQLVLARKRGPRGVKIAETSFLGPEQRPLVLFADPEDAAHPWGTALEKLIAQAIAQAEQQGAG